MLAPPRDCGGWFISFGRRIGLECRQGREGRIAPLIFGPLPGLGLPKFKLGAGRWLRVEMKGEWGDRSVKTSGSSKTITSQRMYTVELANNGRIPLSDLRRILPAERLGPER